jgi:TPR repeat protein
VRSCENFGDRVHFRFIAILKLPFKFYSDDRNCSTGTSVVQQGKKSRQSRRQGRLRMAGIELAVSAAEPTNAEECFGLGMIYSAGAGVAVDMVAAHQWFNIAAMRGHKDAARLRREIAEQMSDPEIGQAQRAARDWLKAHPQPIPQPTPEVRVAA